MGSLNLRCSTMFSALDNGKPKKLNAWDYAKVIVPSAIGSMALMGLVHGGFGKLNKSFPRVKAFNPNYKLPLPKIFPKFTRAPGFLEHMNAEAAVDIPITIGVMAKAQHDIGKKQEAHNVRMSGLGKISEVMTHTPGVYLKGMPNRSGKIRIKRGLSITGVKM
jgi:hypothetical protein